MASDSKHEEDTPFEIESQSLSTRAIHADNNKFIKHIDASCMDGGLSPTLSLSTTFDMNTTPQHYTYIRHNQPTRSRLEHLFTKIENGTSSIIYPSGVSAIHSLFQYYKPKRIIANRGYKGSLNCINDLTNKIELLKNENMTVEYLQNNLQPKLSSNDIIFIECPSNPYLSIFDIEPLTKYIHLQQSKIIIDSTIATPIIIQPFKYGIDIIIHSLTKFIGGHSDICGGVVIFNHKINANLCADAYKIRSLRTKYGNVLGSLETWLVIRSLRSLSSRIKIQSINACKVAQFLCNKENTMNCIENIYHTSLETHPNYNLALKYFERDILYFNDNEMKENDNNKGRVLHPALICIICSSEKIARLLIKKFNLIMYATSFGGVETTIDLRSKFDSEIDPRCLRLSVGLESYIDIINDFKYAFKGVQKELDEIQKQIDSTKQNKTDKKSKKGLFSFSSRK